MNGKAPRVALVTGGASGLGLAIVRRLHADGAIVIAGDLRSPPQSDEAQSAPSFMPLDVRDEANWNSVLADIEGKFGGLDILVNNAGIVGPIEGAGLDTARLEDWRNIFAVNVEGVFLGCRNALSLLARSDCGAIVNMASIASLGSSPHAVAYGASKAAVRQLTRSVAEHCAASGLAVRCNCVHPGDVHTPLWEEVASSLARSRGVDPERILAERDAAVPTGRITTPEDVAAAVAFLASPDARQINGSEIVVDGGLMGCNSFHIGASVAHRLASQGTRTA